ncbi:hypothetical protein [Paenibacillus protaetiae]|uniref:hypothetical protein n=1 Tax=Paenibacillus protaetiae TaxID=2509456 RepID=UPI001ABED1C8|nr:hypothetical protein [Paenibacillus protaetiae]
MPHTMNRSRQQPGKCPPCYAPSRPGRAAADAALRPLVERLQAQQKPPCGGFALLFAFFARFSFGSFRRFRSYLRNFTPAFAAFRAFMIFMALVAFIAFVSAGAMIMLFVFVFAAAIVMHKFIANLTFMNMAVYRYAMVTVHNFNRMDNFNDLRVENITVHFFGRIYNRNIWTMMTILQAKHLLSL